MAIAGDGEDPFPWTRGVLRVVETGRRVPLVTPGANERHQQVLPGREHGQLADEAGTTWMVALGGVDVVGDPSHGVKTRPCGLRA